jgi:hypothetical protein
MSRKCFTPATLAVTTLAPALLLPLGCASEPASKPTTRTSDAALQDPYGNWSKIDDDNSTDVSGGGTGNLDKKGLKRDLDHFLLK